VEYIQICSRVTNTKHAPCVTIFKFEADAAVIENKFLPCKMDSEDADYPAINKALGLLRARLFAQQSDANPDCVIPTSASANCRAETSKEEPVQIAANQKKDVGSNSSASLLIKRIALEKAKAVYSMARSSSRNPPLPVKAIPREIIAKLSFLHSNYILRSCLDSWKLRMRARRKNTRCYAMALNDLNESHLFWQKVLPDSTKTNCVQRLGKLKLAVLHAKLYAKRRAMIGWITCCLLSREGGLMEY